MATLAIALSRAGKANAVVLKTSARVSEFIATSGASQSSTNIAVDGEYWHLAVNGDEWVTFGAAPTAVKGTTFFMPAGSVLDLEAVAGDKVAVIDNS